MCEVVDLEEYRIKKQREDREVSEQEDAEQTAYVKNIIDIILTSLSPSTTFFDTSDPDHIEQYELDCDTDEEYDDS
jgi:hypothetical protein